NQSKEVKQKDSDTQKKIETKSTSPHTGNPYTENPHTGNPYTENPYINNTNNKNTKINNTNNKNTKIDQNLNHMNDYIWNMKLPMPLKKFFSDKVKVLVNDPTFDISIIEYFYNTYENDISPDCTREDVWFLNDIEFTYV